MKGAARHSAAQPRMTTKSVPRTKREPKVEAEPVTAPVAEKEPTIFENFIEHQRKAFDETGLAIESLLPVAFKEHSKTALQETIEGYRQLVNSVIDSVVEQIEKMRPADEAEAEKEELKEQVPQP
jgi:hypothetical protein